MTSRTKKDYNTKLSGPSGKKTRELIEEFWGTEQLYTGAKAAFEVFGDCELARCMLRQAMKKNPIIIRRILGKATIPGAFIPSAYEVMGDLTKLVLELLSDDFCYTPRMYDVFAVPPSASVF